MRNGSAIFTILLFIFFQVDAEAIGDARPLTVRGYVKEMPSINILHRQHDVSLINLMHNRFNLKYAPDVNWEYRFEIRNRIFIGDINSAGIDFGKRVSYDPGLVDLGFLWVDNSSMVMTTAIDRMMVRYNNDAFTCTFGRQRINWGMNTVWNPLDLFNAYNFIDFDYEERPGSDVLRLQFSGAGFSTIELAMKYGRNFESPVCAGLFRSNFKSYDWQLLGGFYEDDMVLGAGWAGPLRDAGFKGEVARFQAVRNKPMRRDVFTWSVSLDYSFSHQWFGVISVLYNDNSSYLQRAVFTGADNLLSAKQLMPFRWSFYSGCNKQFNPVFSGSLAVVYAPEKNSTIIFPSLLCNVRENLDLDLTVQAFFEQQDAVYRALSTSAFVRMRWSY